MSTVGSWKDGVGVKAEASGRTREVEALVSPDELLAALPRSPETAAFVETSRDTIREIIHGRDRRLLVVVGPCSIHDVDAALEYGRWLADLRARWQYELMLVMRVYVEKPRTRVGWKGLINDPDLTGTGRINLGLRAARQLFVELNRLRLPVATEFLDMISPQYLGDLVAWTAVGARTTESQLHRQMVSGLPIPTGFKNTTDGNVEAAVNAILSAATEHHFVSLTGAGTAALVITEGNPDCHVVLRGGRVPNYDAAAVDAACHTLVRHGLGPRIMVDCSHGNAVGDVQRQLVVAADVSRQVASGSSRVLGVMLESNLVAGAQRLVPGEALRFGQSITDPCLGLDDTALALEGLARAVRQARG